MAKVFNNFLKKYKVTTKSKVNIKSMPPKSGKYYIPDSKYDEFLSLYELAIKEEDYYLVENNCENQPILVDVDIKSDISVNNRLYVEDDIIELVKLYNKHISEIYDVNADQITAYVFERDMPYKDINKSITKDGVHIIYPYIVATSSSQRLLRSKILKEKPKILSLTDEEQHIVLDAKVLDSSGWMMYGSRKNISKSYKLTKIYTHDMDELAPEEEENLCSLFSIRNKKELSPIFSEMVEEVEKYKKKINKHKLESKTKKFKAIDIEYIINLTKLLSAERATDYTDWRDVGLCLHNIDTGNELFYAWLDFSKKSEKYDKISCNKFWESFNQDINGYHIGSLIYWAKEDNLEEFNELEKKHILPYIEEFIEYQTHLSLANLLYKLYGHCIKCIDYKKNKWVEYVGHRWKQNDGQSLRNKLKEDIRNMIAVYISGLNNEIGNKELDESDPLMIKRTEACKMLRQIGMERFVADTIKQCKDIFIDENFIKKLNMNPNLMIYNNGVYDFKKMEFRDGRPDDNFIITTDIDYIEYDPECLTQEELMIMLKKIFPKKSVLDYALKLISSCLSGENTEQELYLLNGGGANGKSTMANLIIGTFGEFAGELDISALTQKRQNSSKPRPELIDLRYKRFVMCHEPSDGDKLCGGVVKQYSGGDRLSIRNLYDSEIIRMQIMFKIFILCNHLPDVGEEYSHDFAMWRRLVALEFESRFVNDPIEEYEYEKDPELASKVISIEWREAFMSLLVHYYKKYKKEGLHQPPEITEFTKEYKEMSNIYSSFMSRFTKTDSATDIIILDDIYEEFKEWFMTNKPSGKPPDSDHFKVRILGESLKCKIRRNTKRLRNWTYNISEMNDE